MKQKEITNKIYYWLFLGYFAILPMSNTVALRNIFLIFLLGILLYEVKLFYKYTLRYKLKELGQLPIVFIVWIIFLFFFPLFAIDEDIAWNNFKGQWSQSIIAFFVGFGAVKLLGKDGPGLWALAFASSFSTVVHLIFVVFAWIGFFGVNPPTDINLSDFFQYILVVSSSQKVITWGAQNFPWGFWGLEVLPSNLGFSACHSFILYGVCFCLAWYEKNNIKMLGAFLGLILGFLSILIAGSRGALIYGIFLLMAMGVLCFFRLKNSPSVKLHEERKRGMLPFLVFPLILFSGLVFFVAIRSVENDIRWSMMFDKVKLGFQLENPTDILCNGVSKATEEKIRKEFSDKNIYYVDALLVGLKTQDGARILLMRAGAGLLVENPLGLDGSRDSYKKLIEKKCGHPPVLEFAHLHQGWFDMILGIGLVGTIIFAWMMTFFLKFGWVNMSRKSSWPWAFSLFLISFFWISRGFVDSVFREHYLQMQAFLMGYLFFRINLNSADEASRDLPVKNSP